MQELSTSASSVSRRRRKLAPQQHANDRELQQTISQLRAQLLTIEPDVEELEDAIAAIEEPGVARRLGISDSEVRSRRSVVQRIKGDLEVRAAVAIRALKMGQLTSFSSLRLPDNTKAMPTRNSSTSNQHSLLSMPHCSYCFASAGYGAGTTVRLDDRLPSRQRTPSGGTGRRPRSERRVRNAASIGELSSSILRKTQDAYFPLRPSSSSSSRTGPSPTFPEPSACCASKRT